MDRTTERMDRQLDAAYAAEDAFLAEQRRTVTNAAERLGVAPVEVTPAVLAVVSVLTQLTRENDELRRRVAELERAVGIPGQ